MCAPGRRALLRALLILSALICSLAIFFRSALTSGFDLGFGDRFDGVIEISLLEHWFNVFRGASSWAQTFSFYPWRDTLGYNDGYLILGLIYAPLRALGCNPFLAAELTDVVVKLAGFLGFLAFARLTLGLRLWAATLGASVFTVADNSYVQGSHVQLFTVGFAPVLATLLAAVLAAVASGRRSRACLLAVLSSLLLSAWLLTAFYMAWFFLAYALIFGAIAAIAFRGPALRVLRSQPVAACVTCLVLAASFAISVVPFLLLYLPKAAESGMHGFHETFGYLSRPIDLLQLGGDSLLYAGMQRALQSRFSSGGEFATGFTPIILALFLLSTVWALRRAHEDSRSRLAGSVAIAAIGFWLLSVHLGNHTLWWVVYKLVPGARGIRVISRVQIFLQWPVVLVAVFGLQEALAQACLQRPGRRVVIRGLVLFLCASSLVGQLNRVRVSNLSGHVEMGWLRAVASPPAACRVFFVSHGRPYDPGFTPYLWGLVEPNIAAMLVAEWLRRPTINGFATFQPPGWDLLSSDRQDYPARVSRYASAHHLIGLCGLDLTSGAWSPPLVLAKREPPTPG